MDLRTRKKITMPDVGLTSSVEPLDPDYKVVIKYSVEVDGLCFYAETYDAAELLQEYSPNEKG